MKIKDTVVLAHMLGYVSDEQKDDARGQGLAGDDMHLLGYLDSPQWAEAFKMFTGQDLVELKNLAKLVDLNYNTNFYAESGESELSQRDLLIDKYTKRLAILKENQIKEDEGRPSGLSDVERHEFEALITICAETIRDLKALPNL